MAHYKRGRPRTKANRGRGSTTNTNFRKRKGIKPARVPHWMDREDGIDYWPGFWGGIWLGNWPRYWDILHHTRPRRRAERAMEHKVIEGIADLDDLTWPLDKKPHQYYW